MVVDNGKEIIERNLKEDIKVDGYVVCLSRMAYSTSYYVVAEDGKSMVRLTFDSDMDGAMLYLSDLYVNDKQRHVGIGDKLLDIAEYIARENNIFTIRLGVYIGTWMIDWYSRRGYLATPYNDLVKIELQKKLS